MPATTPSAPIVAIVYGDGARVGPILNDIVDHLLSAGYRLAGLLQRDRIRVGRSRCDMLMEDLTTGETMAVSQDRGEGARGCRLDVEALINAVVRVRNSLAAAPDLLIVNKFGKTECEGGGCRSLIVDAVEIGVPVLVAVPYGNLDPWRSFAGDLAVEYLFDDLPPDTAAACRKLGFASADKARDKPDAPALQAP